jgi:hypothetical protein
MGVLVGGARRPTGGAVAEDRDAVPRVDPGRAGAAVEARFDYAAQPKEHVSCNLCGPSATVTVANTDRYGFAVRVVECVRCGLRYLNPRMTAEAYTEFYARWYRPLVDKLRDEPQAPFALENEQWQYAAGLSEVIAPFLSPDGGTAIDVGGSTGVVGRMLRARWGYDATVIDPCLDELARARDCQQIHASAEEAVFPPADVALLCRTVDHLLDPRGVLERLREAAPLLVVDALDVTYWPANSRYKVDHPFAFTARTLSDMVKAAGWHPVEAWIRKGGLYCGLVCRREK